jgi:AraC-like DNA-binding protein
VVARPDRERDLCEHVAYLLRQHIDGRVTLSEIARAVGYSEFHLCRVFRRTMGLPIQAFHRELRLRHALALVLDTHQPLAAIALDTGFASQAHLTTKFCARFGVTPGRARAAGAL